MSCHRRARAVLDPSDARSLLTRRRHPLSLGHLHRSAIYICKGERERERGERERERETFIAPAREIEMRPPLPSPSSSHVFTFTPRIWVYPSAAFSFLSRQTAFKRASHQQEARIGPSRSEGRRPGPIHHASACRLLPCARRLVVAWRLRFLPRLARLASASSGKPCLLLADCQGAQSCVKVELESPRRACFCEGQRAVWVSWARALGVGRLFIG